MGRTPNRPFNGKYQSYPFRVNRRTRSPSRSRRSR